MSMLIKSGRVVDPANNIDKVCDILVDKGIVVTVGGNIRSTADTVIDAKGKIVMPGIVDMHVHLREPGREDKETIASGTAAAVKGGVTTLLAMPNTEPAIDSVDACRKLQAIIERDARAHVYIAAAITLGRKGAEPVDFAALKAAGAIAFTDDGSSVGDASVMGAAFRSAHECSAPILCHSEDGALSANGVVNRGLTSTRLGLRGISNASEFERVRRDIELAVAAKAPVHIQHVSCRESVEIIAEAKKQGVSVTAETAPHYFTLTEDAVLGYETNMKMNPPLRSSSDRDAIIQGVRDGTIDAIASDHAPHTQNDKEIEFDRASFGVIGLETELAVALTELIGKGVIDWPELARLMSLNPARILGIDKGMLSVGSAADITIIDPDKEWVIERSSFVSKSKNSCFLGRAVRGAVVYTIVRGLVAYSV